VIKSLALAAVVLAGLLSGMLPAPALAQSAVDPVNRIMEVAKARLMSSDGPAPDYFDGLDEDFTRDFAAVYREAAKYPAYEDGDTPFDYDVITASQDGCPLKDIAVAPQGEKDGLSFVDVSFKLWTCAPDAESQARINQLRFDVAMENGVPLIADIHRLSDGKWDTLLGEMKANIEQGKKNAQ
jgi:hypothetical protein